MRPSFASAASLLAMAAILASAPMAARAQSFNATGTIVAGAGSIITGAGTTTVATDSPNVVINWSPNDTVIGGGPIEFQTAGTSALFTNQDATVLTVLNRIVPNDVTRPIVFNGTVRSQLVDLGTGAISRGGTVFFYSPGGILVSSTGVFDIGNLVLTASDLNYDTATGAFGTAGTFNFLPANAGSRVEVQKGAQIRAGLTNAYVALIAPKVVQSGTIDVDGSAVIVAADASTITFRPNGLFDIQIDQGTSAAGEVVTHDGTITGPVGTINTAHRVYMVAVPRNDAITMAIKAGSSLGFDVAGAADVDGNAVVLSAGYGVTGGAIDLVRSAAGGAVPAALAVGAITATSQVTGKATGQASLTVDSGNTSNFASNLSLSGVRDPAAATDDGAFISVGGVGSTLDLTGNLQLTALDAGQVAGAAITDSGNASVTVDQGTLTVGGSATISSARAPTVDLDALAGTAALAARGGATVGVGGDLTISARAEGIAGGTAGPAAPPTGPNAGTGGTAQLSLEGASTVTIRGNLLLDASGVGGSALLDGLVGASGTGGQALIDGKAGGGTLGVGGGTTLDARGFGGDGQRCISCTVEGGTGTGGSASVIAASGATFTLDGLLGLDASGRGGSAATDSGKDGGAAQGGSAFVRSTGGRISTAQSLVVRAEGLGGAGATVNAFASGLPGSGGTGGRGTGGAAGLIAGDASAIGGGGLISSVNDTVVSAQGIGGSGGNGGAGLGGTAAVSARNGTVTGSALVVRGDGIGGSGFNGGYGGAGQGTSADVIAYSALEGDAKVTFLGASVSARGDGGTGSSPAFFDAPGGAGGNGTGGSARALAEAGNGALSLGETSINASGNGGNGGAGFTVSSIPITGQNGGAGGTGRAGTAQIGVVSGLDTGAVNTGSADFAPLSVTARGTGGSGGAASVGASTPGAAGNGGVGYGGGASLVAQGGKVTIAAPALVDAGGIGGSTGLGGTAGNGFVGDAGGAPLPLGARLEVGSRSGQPAQKGALVAADLTFSASAETGKGGTPGNATVLGRPLAWRMSGGTIDAGNMSFLAVGTPTATAPSSDIALAGGNTTLTGDLSFVTPGTLTASFDAADVRAVNVTLTAADWLEGLVPAGAAGTLFGSGSVALGTSGNLFGHLSANSGGALSLTSAAGLVRLDDLTAVGDIDVTANTTVTLGNVQAGGSALITAPGNVTVGNVGAAGSATVSSQASLVTGGVSAGQRIRLDGIASLLSGGPIAAGDSVLLNSDGTLGAGAVSAGLVSPSALPGATYSVTVLGRGGIALGDVGARGDVALLSPNAIASGSISGNEVVVLGAGNQVLGGITAAGRVLLADYEMAGFGGNPLVSYNLAGVFAQPAIATSGLISLSGPTSAGQLTALTLGSIIVQDVTVQAAGAANGTVNLQAGTALGTGAVRASGRIDLQSGTTMTTASATAGDVLVASAGGALTAGDLAGVGGVTITGLGAVTTGLLSATGGNVAVTAAGDLATGAVTGGGTVQLGGRNVLAGAVDGAAVTMAANGTLGFGNVSARTGTVSGNASGTITGGAITAADTIQLGNSAGGVTLGNLAAANTVLINGTGNVQIGNASAGLGTVEVRANGGSLTANAVTAATDAALIAAGDIALDAVQSRDMVLLAGGSIRADRLTSPNGRILAAGNGLAAAGGTIGAFNFDAVFAQPLVAAGGSLTLVGAATGATFAAAVAGDAATQGISATRSILVDAGGTARLGGVWQSPVIELRASDLDLPTGAGLNAGLTGTITLVSRNAAGLRIGDGLDASVVPTSGFSLDNGEWSRINSGSLFVSAPDVSGPVDILIGKLDMTGPDAGSTIDDPLGAVQFTTGAAAAGTFGGTIRVAGALATTGFRATNALVFRTGQFQLASDTGSIAVQGTGGALSGTLRINARDIHVAAGSLLAQLAVDPFFAGVEPALDQVSAGGNGPVLRAGALDFTVGRSFYIQRTGAGFDPLGFEEPLDTFRVTQASAAPIAVIINGTFRTATGLVSGAAAWRQFKASGFDFSGFTADSRLNGCLLTALTCGVSLQPDPGIRTIIEFVDKPILDDAPLDPENPPPQSKDAIVPPPLLLPVQPDALPGQVDEPIAGSGNPALIAGGGLEGARP